jgi:hypothetical protein
MESLTVVRSKDKRIKMTATNKMSGNVGQAKKTNERTGSQDENQNYISNVLNETSFKAYSSSAAKGELITDKIMVVDTKAGKVMFFAENIVDKMKGCKGSESATQKHKNVDKFWFFKNINETPFYTRFAYTETEKKTHEVRNSNKHSQG